MPKQPITRGMLAVAVVAAATLGLASAWQLRSADDGPAAHSVAGEPRDIGRRQQELRFLKGAFDRLEAEAKQNPNSPALRSLRTEQEAVLERMREVVRPLSHERTPNDLQALLAKGLLGGAATTPPAAPEGAAKDEGPPASRPSSIAAPIDIAVNPTVFGELKPGLASAVPAPNVALSRDPGLNGVVLIARPRPPRPPAETVAERPADRQPADANLNGSPATKPAPKAQATVRAPEKPAPLAASGASERPPAGPVAILGR